MKKALYLGAFLVLAAQLPVWGYDTSPSRLQIVPEVIWAPATGGGTWVTEIQITCRGDVTAFISAYFDYADGSRGPITLHAGLLKNHNARFPNILSQLQALDSSFTYYGRVGALTVFSADAMSQIQVQAKTINGNYGKTFPGLNPLVSTTAAVSRPMMIQDLVQNAKYRTFIGAYNEYNTSMTVKFVIEDANANIVGAAFTKTIDPLRFVSFNPFVEAGVPTGTYENCWLFIEVTVGGTGTDGVMCFGSIANNYTNDSYALMARMFI